MENSETGHQEPSNHPKLTGLVKSNKRLLAGLILIVIIALALGLYFMRRPQQKRTAAINANKDPSQVVTPITPKPPTEGYEKAVYDADKLYVKGDYDGMIALLKESVPKTTDKEQLFTIKEKIGKAYQAKGDWQNAINWFEQAQATGSKYADSLYPVIAEMAEKLNDNKRAIAAYKKAYDILATNKDPVAKKIAAKYLVKIKSLGGS